MNTTRKRMQVDALFAQAEESQEVLQLEGKIDELTQEIQRLRRGENGTELEEQKLQELRQELLVAGSLREIPVAQMKPNPKQPRKTFTPLGLQLLAKSLSDDGQQDPLVLIEVNPEEYLIFDGERRWRATSAYLNWETLKAVIIPEPEQLHRRVLIANLHREELNQLDIGEALLNEIQFASGLDTQTIICSLRTVIRRLDRRKQFNLVSDLLTADVSTQSETLGKLEISDTEQTILSILLSLRLNPSTVSSGAFVMLQLPVDLKKAVREKGLNSSHALAIHKINAKFLNLSEVEAEKLRQSIVDKVLEQKLSVSETKALVATYFPGKTSSNKFDSAVKAIHSIEIQSLGEFEKEQIRQALVTKLAELNRG
jgi:ParB family chromosome partitioning protein